MSSGILFGVIEFAQKFLGRSFAGRDGVESVTDRVRGPFDGLHPPHPAGAELFHARHHVLGRFAPQSRLRNAPLSGSFLARHPRDLGSLRRGGLPRRPSRPRTFCPPNAFAQRPPVWLLSGATASRPRTPA